MATCFISEFLSYRVVQQRLSLYWTWLQTLELFTRISIAPALSATVDTSMPLWMVYCTADSNIRAIGWYNRSCRNLPNLKCSPFSVAWDNLVYSVRHWRIKDKKSRYNSVLKAICLPPGFCLTIVSCRIKALSLYWASIQTLNTCSQELNHIFALSLPLLPSLPQHTIMQTHEYVQPQVIIDPLMSHVTIRGALENYV